MRRTAGTILTAVFLVMAVAAPALACGGLVNPNGTVSLTKTTTLVGYVDGVEHYVTSFEFAGAGGEFGSIVPLPGIPSKVERAGDWTLQRLVQEVQPPQRELFAADAVGSVARQSKAQVILETKIDALDITVLKGGGDEVGRWAKENGFSLTPDAPEVLDFYAARSPIFMAARFDAGRAAADGQRVGDGTPVHLTIPTPNPWVPLRILGLGLGDEARIQADLFLLTEGIPEMLPKPNEGLSLDRSEEASDLLLADLRSDKNMEWIPAGDMWLSYLKIDTTAGELKHDLAIDATGVGDPSPIAAGLQAPLTLADIDDDPGSLLPWLYAVGIGLIVLGTARFAWQRG